MADFKDCGPPFMSPKCSSKSSAGDGGGAVALPVSTDCSSSTRVELQSKSEVKQKQEQEQPAATTAQYEAVDRRPISWRAAHAEVFPSQWQSESATMQMKTAKTTTTA